MPTMKKYAAENGTLYAKDYTTLYIYPNGKNDKNFTMNASTKKVADFASGIARILRR